MKTLEEQLWDYIDGTATAAEQEAVAVLLATDPAANMLYKQLLELSAHFSAFELEEPSMGFTRNVMDKVALEVPPVALKTRIDKRIIIALGLFFTLTVLAVLAYAVATSSDTGFDLSAYSLKIDAEKYINGTSLKIFLLIDVVIALVYLDSVMRRRLHAQKTEAALKR